jgi:iron complex transport system substrate-binding protein
LQQPRQGHFEAHVVLGYLNVSGGHYPDQLKQDLRETTRSFYRLFYHVEPSDAELDTLLAWSRGQAPPTKQLRR